MQMSIAPKLLATKVVPDGNLNLKGYTCLENKEKWSLVQSEEIRYADVTEVVVGTLGLSWESIKSVTIPEYYDAGTVGLSCECKSLGAGVRTVNAFKNGAEIDAGDRVDVSNEHFDTVVFDGIEVIAGDVIGVYGWASSTSRVAGKNLKILASDTEIPGLHEYMGSWS